MHRRDTKFFAREVLLKLLKDGLLQADLVPEVKSYYEDGPAMLVLSPDEHAEIADEIKFQIGRVLRQLKIDQKKMVSHVSANDNA